MQPRRLLFACLPVVLIVPAQSVAARAQSASPAQHPFTASDWAALHSASVAAVSPDGTILYLVTFGDEKGPTHEEWWTIAFDGTHPVKIELPDGFSAVGFTRDGHSLYGRWKINGLDQFAIFPLSGAKATTVPSTTVLLPRGIKSALPSPDGSRYALIADPRPPDPLGDVRHVIESPEASIYVVGADGTAGAWWCPSLQYVSADLLGGGGALAWNSDGQSLAVLSDLPRIGHHDVATFIGVCSASGPRHVVTVPNAVSSIAWANEGRDLAFLSTRSAVLTPEHVYIVSAAGGAVQDRTPTLDGTALTLDGDSRGRVFVLVDRGLRREVDEFRDGALTTVWQWPDGVIASLPVDSPYAEDNDKKAFTVADPTHARNVAVVDANGLLRKITHEGDAELAPIAFGPVRDVHWTSKDGIHLEGKATFPADYVEGRKYPFLVLPHGGPESNDEFNFDYLSRIIAGLGYVVLQPEYRGSTGYGADFLGAIYQHFGDRAYEDVDSATDFAIAQGWADPNRLAIFGWSAGGFMTSWTVTQTHRYKAAVEGAGITDWAPFLWTSDIQQTDYDARWTDQDPEAFRKFSAVDFAKNVTTPLLILHGEADQRVPTFQGVEYFQILAARGVTVRLVTYPGSPHFPVVWEQRLDVIHEIDDWLAKYNP